MHFLRGIDCIFFTFTIDINIADIVGEVENASVIYSHKVTQPIILTKCTCIFQKIYACNVYTNDSFELDFTLLCTRVHVECRIISVQIYHSWMYAENFESFSYIIKSLVISLLYEKRFAYFYTKIHL